MPDGPDETTRARPATSRLALASLVMGALSVPLFCCSAGVSGAIAASLGLIAIERIRSSGGALRGRWMAWTGIGTGVLSIILGLGFATTAHSLQLDWNRQVDRGVRRTFAAIDAEAARLALQDWSPASSSSVSSAEIELFARRVHEELGAFESMSIVSTESSPGLLGNSMLIHVVNLDFEKGRRSGVVTARLRTPAGSWVPEAEIARIHVNDETASEGAYFFPPTTSGPSESVADGDKTNTAKEPEP